MRATYVFDLFHVYFMSLIFFNLFLFLEPSARRGKLTHDLTLDNDGLFLYYFDNFRFFFDNRYDFYVKSEVGVKFAQRIFYVAFVKTGIVSSWIFEL